MAKKKHKKNITGLRNQSQMTSHVKEAPNDGIAKDVETAPTHTVFHADVDGQSDNDEGWEAHIRLDSNKLCWELEDESEDEDEDIDDDERDVEDEVIVAGEDMWRSEGLHIALMVLMIDKGDDPRDEDWIPDRLRRKHNARIAQGEFVAK